MPRTKPKNYLLNPTSAEVRELQQRNRPMVTVLKRRGRATVIIDLCEGFLGSNRYVFTPMGRLMIHQIMTSKPYKSTTCWQAVNRIADASYSNLEDAIAVAELLGQLPDRGLKLWEWCD